jgi:hypothetical protein
MTYEIDRTERDGYTITTFVDDDLPNPQDWYDHAAVIIGWSENGWAHRTILDDQAPGTWTRADGAKFELARLRGDRYSDYDDVETGFAEWCDAMTDAFGPDVQIAVLDYADYGSNGARVTLETDLMPVADFADIWQQVVYGDGRIAGIIAVSSLTTSGTDPEHWPNIARCDVAELTAYLSGDCYGYEIEGPNGETIDAIGGFYGNYDHVVAEAERALDHAIEDHANVNAWLHAEAEWHLTIPDLTTMLAADAQLFHLNELA